MTKQEENWEMMTALGIPWHHACKIDDEADRTFLLARAKELKERYIQEQMAMNRERQQLSEQGQALQQMQQQAPPSQSPIVTPGEAQVANPSQ